MTKVFLTKNAVSVKSGYLSKVGKEMNPINDDRFVSEQAYAEYLILFAEKVKGKDFVGKKADDLDAFKHEIVTSLTERVDKEFVKAPVKPDATLTTSLKEEALAFMECDKDGLKVEKINLFLNDNFPATIEFEEIGLFFEPGIVKVNKIYTMKEIVKAVTEVIELL